MRKTRNMFQYPISLLEVVISKSKSLAIELKLMLFQ
jgi:hypothetical protein